MTGLKTLKDIEDCKPIIYEDESRIEAQMTPIVGKWDDTWIMVDDLRQAAREWINYWEHTKENCGYTEEIEACYDSQISAFKHFFNLEDEND